MESHGYATVLAAPCTHTHAHTHTQTHTHTHTQTHTHTHTIYSVTVAWFYVQYFEKGLCVAESQVSPRASFSLTPAQQVELQVDFCPVEPLRVEARIQLQVEENHFGEILVHLVGEGFHNDVILDNIRSLSQQEETNGELS